MGESYELKRCRMAFERLVELQNEVQACALSLHSSRINSEECSDEELSEVVIYCQLSSELRDIILRYKPDLVTYMDVSPGKFHKLVNWACAARPRKEG